jgi:RimJ/RimL family protein N-acetyltransferase
MLSDHWPLFDLRVRTPRLELRYPSDDDLAALAALTREQIHDPGSMPFAVPWTRVPDAERPANALRHWWSQRAGLVANEWTLVFLVSHQGEPVGVQDLAATAFPVTRSVRSGSWLVQRHQGRGIGKEMRAAVLHLAFAGLGAHEAHTSSFEDNAASLGVTRSLGYQPNGSGIDDREGIPVRHLRFLLTRGEWQRRRRDDIAVENLDPCLPFLGATEAPAGA